MEHEGFLTCKQLQIFRKRLMSPFSGPVHSKKSCRLRKPWRCKHNTT